MTAVEFSRLVKRARRRADGVWWDACCPAHDDRKASLSFRDGDHRLILKCQAGCEEAAIVAAVGLTLADLTLQASPRIVAEYDYHDERGTLLYQVVRFEPKDFRQRRPDGAGDWIWNLNGVRRVLYRLPELIAAMKAKPPGERIAFVPEGEKDVESLLALGFVATCNPGGAGKWRPEYSDQLKAAGVEEVVVLDDNDVPGGNHVKVVIRSCLRVGLRVRNPRLPGLPPRRDKHGEDVSAWRDAGHTREELAEIVARAPLVPEGPVTAEAAGRGFHLVPLGDLLNEPDEETPWLVDQRLPVSGLSLLAGKPKAGKSTLARCLALAVARGDPWLGFKTTRGLVLYLALEEKRAEVRRHFKAMGATSGDPIKVFIAPSPQDGLAQLRQAAERERPVLIIVDPLMKLVRVRDANDYAVVMQALEPLLSLARETGAHLLAVHHLGKGERSGGDAILGSTAIFAAVDTALLLKRSDRYRTLSSIQRAGDDLEEIVLTLDLETRIVSAGQTRKEADEAQAAEAILEYLKTRPEPIEEGALHEAVEGRKGPKAKALRALVENNRVTRTGEGKRGAPYLYSISSFLVPTYIREPENQKSRTDGSADGESTYSGSRENARLDSGSREEKASSAGALREPEKSATDEMVL